MKLYNATEEAKSVNPFSGINKLSFHVNPAIVNEYNSLDWLKIHYATCVGWDKDKVSGNVLSFDQRIHKVNQNAHSLVQIAQSTDECPYQAMAVIYEFERIRRHLLNGYDLADYQSHLMLEIDASNSLLQFFAAVSGCKKTARLVNLLAREEENPIDGYTEFYREMRKNMTPELCNKYDKVLTRKALKQIIMEYLYAGLSAAYKMFGRKSQMFALFEATLYKLAPGAMRLRKEILNTLDRKATGYTCIRPDGFVMNSLVTNKQECTITVPELLNENNNPCKIKHTIKYVGSNKTFCAILANFIHFLDSFLCAELQRRMSYDEAIFEDMKEILEAIQESNRKVTDRSTIVCATDIVDMHFIISETDSIDELLNTYTANQLGMALELVNDCLFIGNKYSLVTIHDAFKTTADGIGALRFHYKRFMAEIANSNLAEDLLSQLKGKPVIFKKESDDLASHILLSDYAIM